MHIYFVARLSQKIPPPQSLQHGETMASLQTTIRRQGVEISRLHAITAQQQHLLETIATATHVFSDADTLREAGDDGEVDIASALALLDIENEGLRKELDAMAAEMEAMQGSSEGRRASEK